MHCPRCQRENRPQARFCEECAAPLSPSTRAYADLKTEVNLKQALTEAFEQQTATADILQVISNSPTDAQPVFDVIVKSAVRVCGGLHGTVYRVQDGLIHLVAHHNFSPEALAFYEAPFRSRSARKHRFQPA